MKNKAILISIDGMRPDGVMQCENPYVEELMKMSSYTMNARTVFPSVTLPCHMSMFHSVPVERHGITTNRYTPPVRPINGLFEQIKAAGKISTMFFGWEPLRDISRPGSLMVADYQNWSSAENVDRILTNKALACIDELHPDFVFLYMVDTDGYGHDNGWMSDSYIRCIYNAFDDIKRVIEHAGDEYTVIVATDHGGHDRTHGTDMEEDMIIPLFFYGKEFEHGRILNDVSILDIAPTIADIMGILPDEEWEGRSLIGK